MQQNKSLVVKFGMFVKYFGMFVNNVLDLRKLFVILLCCISSAALGNTYYVATTGSDTNGSGSISNPWATWNYGIRQLTTGDTLFIRAGLYMATGAVSISANPNNGTANDPIVVMGYPGDATRPILDGSNLNQTSLLRIEYKSYWTIKRIEIRESHDTDGVYTNFCGINCYSSNQIRLENIIVHDIDGQGIRIQDCDTIYVRDCDSYNNYDPYNNGGKADGFQINSTPPIISMVYFDRCRAWNNSDDGWDFLDNTRGVVDSCWAWNNGYDTDGSGQGFKTGLQTGPPPSEAYIFTNNIAVYNSHGGMRANCNGQEWYIDSRWYNNTVAFNLQYGFSSSNLPGAQMNTNIWRNNISYSNIEGDWWEDASALTRDHNSWDIAGLVVNNSDFLSVDSTGIAAPRKISGDLPDNSCYNNFLKLAAGSDLINKGIDVGLTQPDGSPDLGAFEFSSGSASVIQISRIDVTGTGGFSTITRDKGTLQLFTTIYPSNATNKSVTWSIINGTGQATISPAGLVTAVSNGTVTARATAKDGSGVYGSLVITISNQVVSVSGITVSAAGGTASIPASNGTLQLNASVLPANATDKSVTWSIINGTGQATISPAGLVTAVSNGTVTARATAKDGSGVYGSLVITISNQNAPANIPPQVSISSPTKSTAFVAPATVTIEANAADPDGTIVRVEFFNGNIKLGEKTTSPYDFTWKDVPEGSYSITAIATDNWNARTVSGAVTVVVEKSTTDINQLPVVSITSPANNSNNKKKYKKDERITVTAEATDPDGSISKVEFKSGNITLAEVTSAPYSFTWEPSDTGTFVITAIAIDNLGASSATSKIELSIVLLSEVYTDNVNIYPNPNYGHFTIELVQGISELSNRLTIFNLAGQHVYSGILEPGERIKEVDISESTSGTYILMITDGNNIIATKKLTRK